MHEALQQGKKHLIFEQTISGNQDWQPIEIPFQSPRIGYRGLRLLLQFEHPHASAQTVQVDDFKLIEWLTPFAFPNQLKEVEKLPTNYIETSAVPKKSSEIKVMYAN
ncbi:hypothetical protein [Algicola sagamiensis]|uniref:hypothetical protein n=1 Tax=Algicola sagamiensis TaxID=163869 RepID=UPI00037591D7|nr:hypothetical protein [Algicola sagamiensis]